MDRRKWLISAGVVAVVLSAVTSVEAESLPLGRLVDDEFFSQGYWQDGKAEVVVYQAIQFVDGESRESEVVILTNVEELNQEFLARADWPHGQKRIIPAVRQSIINTVPLDNQSRHLMATVYHERTDPESVLRLTTSVTDWSGITSKDFIIKGRRPSQRFNSFRDGEGSGELILEHTNNSFFEEQLFLVVRTLKFEDGVASNFRLHPGQLASGVAESKAVSARLTIEGALDGWKVRVDASDGRVLLYHLESKPPNILLNFEHSDGSTWKLLSQRKEVLARNGAISP